MPEPERGPGPEADVFERSARRYEASADELERAAAHLRTSARHLRSREASRAAAHAWAGRGHVLRAARELDELAILHAGKARP